MPSTPAPPHTPTADAAFVSYRIPSAGAYPMGLAQAPDGSVWFVESFLGRLGKLTHGSISEINVPGSDALLGHIAIDRAGNVWADYANRGESRGGVLRLDGSGNVQWTPSADQSAIDLVRCAPDQSAVISAKVVG